ncbi:mechanosensitive ion channel [Sphingomonas aurantiaca]
MTLGRLRAAALPDPAKPARNTLLAIVATLVWLVLIAALVAGLIGYVNFALKVATWLVWGAIVGASLYLMMTFTEDACRTLLSSGNRLGRSANSGFGVDNKTVDQIGVLLSAVLRLLLIMLAVGAVMAPFGAGVGSAFELFGTVANGVTIGQITISPGAVLRSIAVLFVALAIMRGLQHWLVNSYLPTTSMDAGAQNSVTMVARYAGIIAAVLWALGALGIGMEKLAVVLGALSVGIGFGLQAITQNFVSGLILLAERPVKIGDLVRIGNMEGDVKRINVRSTEIQVADRSTLIVPNSEPDHKDDPEHDAGRAAGPDPAAILGSARGGSRCRAHHVVRRVCREARGARRPGGEGVHRSDRRRPRQVQLLRLCGEPARCLSDPQRIAVHAAPPVSRGGDRGRIDRDQDGAWSGRSRRPRSPGTIIPARTARRAMTR